jgi:hypothetical protein
MFKSSILLQDFALSTTSAESIVSTLMFGAVIGSLAGGVVADWYECNCFN